MSETQALKEDITEIKGDVKALMKIVNANHFYMLDTYVKKSEFNEYKKEEIITKRWWAGYVIVAMTFLITIWKIAQPLFAQVKIQ